MTIKAFDGYQDIKLSALADSKTPEENLQKKGGSVDVA